MQLCFVSVHGPRETYFVDEPRTTLFSILHLANALLNDFLIMPATMQKASGSLGVESIQLQYFTSGID
jgi:hypothetical protein